MNSRRRVNSTVIPLRYLKRNTNQRGAWPYQRRAARSTYSVVRSISPRLLVPVNEKTAARYNLGRDNNSLNRSGVSGLLIRKTRMLLDLDRRPVNSTVGHAHIRKGSLLCFAISLPSLPAFFSIICSLSLALD